MLLPEACIIYYNNNMFLDSSHKLSQNDSIRLTVLLNVWAQNLTLLIKVSVFLELSLFFYTESLNAVNYMLN